MLFQREHAVAAIYAAIDEINLQLPEQNQITKSEDSLLFGEESSLDSLTLVNLVMMVEQNIMMETETELLLASESAMSRKRSPYRSIGALADYAVEVANEQGEV